MPWKNVKVRLDLYERVAEQAAQDARSVAQMTEQLLTGALEAKPDWSRGVGGTPVPQRAPIAQRRIEGQTTVDEMLASCPQCAGEFVERDNEDSLVCEDCGYVRDPS